MPTVEASIESALFARVNTLGLGYPIAWPNVNFSKPSDGKYLEVHLIPNTAARVAIGSTVPHRRIGLLQVSVWWPKNKGGSAAIEVAGLVAEHFPADLKMTSGAVTVRVTKAPDVAGLMVDPEGVMAPVTIEWECFA